MDQPAAVRRLEFEVDFPPGHAAAYLLEAPEPILVDAGTLGSSGEADLREGLATHGLEPEDVAHVVLTHLHVDHVGQVGTLREAGDPTLHVPTTFRDRLTRDPDDARAAARERLAAAGVPAERLDDAIADYVKGGRIMRDVVPPSAVDHWIEPGRPTTVGALEVEPLHTPGHDATHVCYQTSLDGERVLFSGDMAIEPFRPIVVHAGFGEGMREGLAAFQTALDRLESLDVDRVYPGHGPVHADLAAIVERDRSTLSARLAECEAQLRESGSHAVHVAAGLAGDESGVARLLPEAVAALAHLARTGRARTWTDDGVRYYAPA